MVSWILQNGQIVLFFAQMLYWLGILIFAGYAVATYKRYTNWQMGMGSFAEKDDDENKSDKPADKDSSSGKKSEKVSVEDFVE